MNLLFDRYPRNTIWSMWSPSLGYYLFMTWRPLLRYTEIESVQIQYFWQQKLRHWEVSMPSIGVDRCYWLPSMNKQLCHLSVARYVDNLAFSSRFYEKITIVFTNIIWLFLQLNNLELAVNLAKWGNLPGAEQLVSWFFFYLNIVTIVLIRMVLADKSKYQSQNSVIHLM